MIGNYPPSTASIALGVIVLLSINAGHRHRILVFTSVRRPPNPMTPLSAKTIDAAEAFRGLFFVGGYTGNNEDCLLFQGCSSATSCLRCEGQSQWGLARPSPRLHGGICLCLRTVVALERWHGHTAGCCHCDAVALPTTLTPPSVEWSGGHCYGGLRCS
jgi:hypothetical protein